MYSSLDRLDLAADFGDGHGGTMAVFVQTDHRTGREVIEETPLSLVFAITRCLLARRAAEERGRRPYRVVYQLADDAPAILDWVVEASGATIVRQIGPVVASLPERAPRTADLERLVADACAHLADEAWRRARVEPSLAQLAAYEHRVFTPCDRDPVTYFTELVTLGALAASVLLQHCPLTWRHATGGIVPFVLAGGERHVDVFGHAQRYLDGRHEDAPSELVAELLGVSLTRRGLLAAYEELSGERIGADDLATRALAGRPDDTNARALAEQLARASAHALRQWGVDIGNALRWMTQRADETDLRPIGTVVHALVARAHRGFDGVREIVAEMSSIEDAIERAIEPHGFLDGTREDWSSEADVRSAVALDLRVPDDAPRFAGLPLADTPDPFAPLLAVWATGYLVGSMDETGTTLLVITPPA